MKKFIRYSFIAALAFASAAGCAKEDTENKDSGNKDTEKEEKTETVEERLAALQPRIEEANAQIEKLAVLASGHAVVSATENSDGSWTLAYLDGAGERNEITASASSQNFNIPVVSVRKAESGLYCWTEANDGTNSYILEDGEQVPAAAGYVPEISADSEGYWTVDGERILGDDGKPVDADKGDSSIIKEISKNADGSLAVTLGSGVTIKLPVQESLNLELSFEPVVPVYDAETPLTFSYVFTGTQAGGAKIAIAERKNIQSTIFRDSKTVKVSFAGGFTDGYIILKATGTDDSEVLRPVFFEKSSATAIHISTAEELKSFARRVNGKDGSEKMDVYLDNDIDMSAVASWTPIGDATFTGEATTDTTFTKTFDGQGHTVKGLKMSIAQNAPAGTVAGFFGVLDGATVKNLTIGEGSTITSSSATFASAGGVAGAVYNATIENCVNYASFDISGGANDIRQSFGGIVGSIYSNAETPSQIKDCKNYGKFKSVNQYNTKNGATGFHQGGVAGFAVGRNKDHWASINGCENYGDMNVQATRNGGIVASLNSYTKVEGCTNYAAITNTDVKASNTRVAGIVSALGANSSATDCVNKGNVTFAVKGNTTQGYAGGVVGQTNDASCVVSGCENYGTVRSDIFNAADRYISIIIGNTNNKKCHIKDNKVGGKIGSYSDDSSVVTITADNFSQYIYFAKTTQPEDVSGNIFAGDGSSSETTPGE